MRTSILLFLFMVLAMTGCAGADSHNPTVPFLPSSSSQTSLSNRHLWGVWDIYLGADHQTAEVVPMRIAGMHLNAVRWLEVTPCKDCLKIGNIKVVEPNVLEADVTLTHPYPGLLKYTGFDVRGIFISGADYTFPVSGRKIAWGDSVSRMLNPDGYTALFNPTEYPPTKPAALGYIPGKMATGGDLSATLNPFAAYRKDAPRRMFEAGGSETRTLRIHAPSGPIHFGYAVDACWMPVDQVMDPLADFPPEANCLEPFRVEISSCADLIPEVGDQALIKVEIYCHQTQWTIPSVTVEVPGLFKGEAALKFAYGGPDDGILLSGKITNSLGAPEGEYPLLIKARCTGTDPNLGDIAAWQVSLARVVPADGWARTWGGTGNCDDGYATAVDGSGNVYVTGRFAGTVDFDPGPDVDNHVSKGSYDVFLTKYDSSGDFVWARTWGGTGDYPYGYGVVVDGIGNVYVTGYFTGKTDFDPGPGVDNHVSNGSADVFLTKFDSSGSFIWARTWGGTGGDTGYGATVDDSGNVCVIGRFGDTVDFDPGPAVDDHVSNGGSDIFLTKFDSSGNFAWARTWGGTEDWDVGNGVSADGSGNAYVTGVYHGAVDFDPGPDVDIHVSNGSYDPFLTKFDSSGDFIWARTWEGTGDSIGDGVSVDGQGNVYVAGRFTSAADFDPGPGADDHISNGGYDCFLTKFNSSGDFAWAESWGGTGYDIGYSASADGSGNVYVTGYFEGAVDFDPGEAVPYRVEIGVEKREGVP